MTAEIVDSQTVTLTLLVVCRRLHPPVYVTVSSPQCSMISCQRWHSAPVASWTSLNT